MTLASMACLSAAALSIAAQISLFRSAGLLLSIDCCRAISAWPSLSTRDEPIRRNPERIVDLVEKPEHGRIALLRFIEHDDVALQHHLVG